MPNRIKDIFSNEMYSFNSQLYFKDEDSYKQFLSAVQTVQEEGHVVPVDGITKISTKVNNNGSSFPLEEQTSIINCVVGPVSEPVTVSVDVGGNKRNILFQRQRIKDKVIISSRHNDIVFFVFSFIPDQEKHTVSYRIQYDKAKTIEELAESFCIAEALISQLYKKETPAIDKNTVSVIDLQKYFHKQKSLLERLLFIEREYAISIDPSLLSDLSVEEQQEIDELYLLLTIHKPVRFNGKLTSTEGTKITLYDGSSKSVIGSQIELTFSGTIDFDILGQTIRMYTANLLENAIVKDIKKEKNGNTTIFYGDTDSKPMFISFSAFKTEAEASIEHKRIMEHKTDYIHALSSDNYIKEYYT